MCEWQSSQRVCGSRPGLMGRTGRWTCGDRTRIEGWMDGWWGRWSICIWVGVLGRGPEARTSWIRSHETLQCVSWPHRGLRWAYDRREQAWPGVGRTRVCATCRSLIYCLKCHYTQPFVPEWRLQASRDLWGWDVGWVTPTSSFIVIIAPLRKPSRNCYNPLKKCCWPEFWHVREGAVDLASLLLLTCCDLSCLHWLDGIACSCCSLAFNALSDG